jgi:diaminopimelate decarboxylase
VTVRYAMKSSPNAAILKARARATTRASVRSLPSLWKSLKRPACASRVMMLVFWLILQLFDSLGLHIDASSGYEVRRAMAAGVAASKARAQPGAGACAAARLHAGAP